MYLQEPMLLKTPPTAVSCACFCAYKGARYPNQSAEPIAVRANWQRCWCPPDLAAHYGVGVAELDASTVLRSDPMSSPCPIVSPGAV